MNEMPSVKTKGSWVTMMVKIRAGSSGARRAQSAERRSARLDRSEGVATSWPSRSRVVLMAAPVLRRSARSSRFPLAVARGDVLGQFLTALERLVDGHPARDRGADVLRHLGAEVRELRDADELDPRCGAWLDPRVVGVG